MNISSSIKLNINIASVKLYSKKNRISLRKHDKLLIYLIVKLNLFQHVLFDM